MSYLKATSIDHINMSVRNLEESVDFYSALFGFEVKKEQPRDDSKIIGNDAIKLCLYEDPNLGRTYGINHFGFHVKNFDQVLDACDSMGVDVRYDIDWEHSRSIYIIDPNGYSVELSEVQGGGL